MNVQNPMRYLLPVLRFVRASLLNYYQANALPRFRGDKFTLLNLFPAQKYRHVKQKELMRDDFQYCKSDLGLIPSKTCLVIEGRMCFINHWMFSIHCIAPALLRLILDINIAVIKFPHPHTTMAILRIDGNASVHHTHRLTRYTQFFL